MEYIPLIALCVSSVLSVTAIVISILSLRNSRRVQHHTQIVSFEQRRQEVRQILIEGRLIVGEVNDEMNRSILMADEMVLGRKASDEFKRTVLNKTKTIDVITSGALLRHEYSKTLDELDRIPSSPSTQARLDLERLGGLATRWKTESQARLKEVRDINQGVKIAIEKFPQDTSK